MGPLPDGGTLHTSAAAATGDVAASGAHARASDTRRPRRRLQRARASHGCAAMQRHSTPPNPPSASSCITSRPPKEWPTSTNASAAPARPGRGPPGASAPLASCSGPTQRAGRTRRAAREAGRARQVDCAA
eukprot:scaffold3370_cov359-Prasinococcus_capsulatus_cf.AAC.6